MIFADAGVRFFFAIDDDVNAFSVYSYDTETHAIRQLLTVDSAAWMTLPSEPNAHVVSHVNGDLYITEQYTVGFPWAEAEYDKVDGVYSVVDSAVQQQLAPPYSVPDPWDPDENLVAFTSYIDPADDYKMWGTIQVFRPGVGDPIEQHLVYRDTSTLTWTSEHLVYAGPTLSGGGFEVFYFLPVGGTTQIPQFNDNNIYYASINPGRAEGYGVDGQYDTEIKIYDYDKTTQVDIVAKSWGHPATDSELLALGEIEYLFRFLDGGDVSPSKWCGYATVMHAVDPALKGADIHYYIAPIEDIIGSGGGVETPGGMSNAVKKFTFNAYDYLGVPPAQNRAWQPTAFWHMGGGRFGFAVSETVDNATGPSFPYLIGVYNWNSDSYEIVYTGSLGDSVGGGNTFLNHMIFNELQVQGSVEKDTIALDLNAPTSPTNSRKLNETTIKGIDGNDLTWAQITAYSTLLRHGSRSRRL
jgi:hypothetical protein